jgi:hypothetical protein
VLFPVTEVNVEGESRRATRDSEYFLLEGSLSSLPAQQRVSAACLTSGTPASHLLPALYSLWFWPLKICARGSFLLYYKFYLLLDLRPAPNSQPFEGSRTKMKTLCWTIFLSIYLLHPYSYEVAMLINQVIRGSIQAQIFEPQQYMGYIIDDLRVRTLGFIPPQMTCILTIFLCLPALMLSIFWH